MKFFYGSRKQQLMSLTQRKVGKEKILEGSTQKKRPLREKKTRFSIPFSLEKALRFSPSFKGRKKIYFSQTYLAKTLLDRDVIKW